MFTDLHLSIFLTVTQIIEEEKFIKNKKNRMLSANSRNERLVIKVRKENEILLTLIVL